MKEMIDVERTGRRRRLGTERARKTRQVAEIARQNASPRAPVLPIRVVPEKPPRQPPDYAGQANHSRQPVACRHCVRSLFEADHGDRNAWSALRYGLTTRVKFNDVPRIGWSCCGLHQPPPKQSAVAGRSSTLSLLLSSL